MNRRHSDARISSGPFQRQAWIALQSREPSEMVRRLARRRRRLVSDPAARDMEGIAPAMPAKIDTARSVTLERVARLGEAPLGGETPSAGPLAKPCLIGDRGQLNKNRWKEFRNNAEIVKPSDADDSIGAYTTSGPIEPSIGILRRRHSVLPVFLPIGSKTLCKTMRNHAVFFHSKGYARTNAKQQFSE
jgi:hypothetical protein